MKRIIVSAVLLLLIGIACFSEYYFSFKSYKEISEFVEKYSENPEKLTEDEFQKIDESFESNKKILNLFYNHEIIENVEIELAALEHFIKINDYNFIMLYLNRLKSKAECIIDEEYFSLGNIF